MSCGTLHLWEILHRQRQTSEGEESVAANHPPLNEPFTETRKNVLKAALHPKVEALLLHTPPPPTVTFGTFLGGRIPAKTR